jgi:uncharacterized membrane-anchored protein
MMARDTRSTDVEAGCEASVTCAFHHRRRQLDEQSRPTLRDLRAFWETNEKGVLMSDPTRPQRVPNPTVMFWILKILTTGVGEVASDFLVKTFNPVVVVLIAAVAFAGVAAVQLSARRYVPWRYWLFVFAVAVFGTMIADVAHLVVGIPYAVTTVMFGAVLLLVFVVWRRTEGTLSVHSIDTSRREVFYWLTVSATFALGTAVGDFTATTARLGFLGSGLVFLALFAVPGALRLLGLPATAAFWWAYILTRPLGASFADWLALPPGRGGLDLGYLWISGFGIALTAIGVAVLQVRHRRAI